MTVPRWKGSCSCSTPAAAGATCHPSWAAGPGTPLAAVGRVAGSRRLGPAAPAGARRVVRRAAVGLVAGLHRRGVGAVEKGGELTGPNPTDRGKAGSKYHILCDANGLPLHAVLSAANTHDSKLFEPLLDTNPAVRGRRGRPGPPRRRPQKLHADKGYDFPRCRTYQHRRRIKVRIARRGIEDKSKPGRVRWVVERTISWLLRFKRLGLRYDRTERTTLPLLTLACTVINIRRLVKTEL
jgi:transposase